jgi:hypothetical protein
VDNLLLKDTVEKDTLDKPVLNTEVSALEILLTTQRVKRRLSNATNLAWCCAGKIT